MITSKSPQIRFLISQIDPPETISEKCTVIEEYLNTHTNELVVVHRGHTTRSQIELLKEAFPDGCVNCCGVVCMSWRVEGRPDQVVFRLPAPHLWIDYRNGYLCESCKLKISTESEEKFRKQIQALHWRVKYEDRLFENPSD